MNRKKTNLIFIAAAFLFVLAFSCLAIAAITEDILDTKYVNAIGLSFFVFAGGALFLLIKNFSGVVSLEMKEKEEKMNNEEDFFSSISVNENPGTLKERFIKAGFKYEQGYLHKRQFSFAKDYINYYLIVAEQENIIEYIEAFVEKAEGLFQNRTRHNKNNAVYLVFFNNKITDEELEYLKKVIIRQTVAQGLPINFDTFLPIIYDTANQKYIIKTSKNRYSIIILHIALRKFYKIMNFH